MSSYKPPKTPIAGMSPHVLRLTGLLLLLALFTACQQKPADPLSQPASEATPETEIPFLSSGHAMLGRVHRMMRSDQLDEAHALIRFNALRGNPYLGQRDITP